MLQKLRNLNFGAKNFTASTFQSSPHLTHPTCIFQSSLNLTYPTSTFQNSSHLTHPTSTFQSSPNLTHSICIFQSSLGSLHLTHPTSTFQSSPHLTHPTHLQHSKAQLTILSLTYWKVSQVICRHLFSREKNSKGEEGNVQHLPT